MGVRRVSRRVTIVNRHEHLERHQDKFVFLEFATLVYRLKRVFEKAPFEEVRVLLPDDTTIMRQIEVFGEFVDFFREVVFVIVDPIARLRISIREDSQLKEAPSALFCFKEMRINLVLFLDDLLLLSRHISQVFEPQDDLSIIRECVIKKT